MRRRIVICAGLATAVAAVWLLSGKTAVKSRRANFDGTDRVEGFEMANVILDESEMHQSVAVTSEDAALPAAKTTRLTPYGSGTRSESEARLTLSLLGRVSLIL